MTFVIRIVSITLILGLLTFHIPLYSELLIIRQTEAGFVPLDESDNDNKTIIEEALLNYQWPMSASWALKPINVRRKVLNETDDLFIADKPYAEELFIQYLIQQSTGNKTYRVVFFPTSLYDLFALTVFSANYEKNNNPLERAVTNLINNKDGGQIDLSEILNVQGISSITRSTVCDVYYDTNKLFIGRSKSAHDYINHELTKRLFIQYPELHTCSNSLNFSDTLKNKTAELLSLLIRTLLNTQTRLLFLSQIHKTLQTEPNNKIITHFIELEYEARKRNAGLLARGSSMIYFEQLGSQKKLIAGSTINEKTIPFEIAYKKRMVKPYSLSFGNSLFAGVVYDFSACVYHFLAGTSVLSKKSNINTVGYGIFINKYNYIEHQNANLFFIPPISNLAALFSSGEYFHPRTKAATQSLKSITKKIDIVGITDSLFDPTGVILISRNPLNHASLFSQFLFDNAQIIQLGDKNMLTREEKDSIEKIIQAQKQASQYYQSIKTLTPAVQKIETNFRKTHPRKAPELPIKDAIATSQDVNPQLKDH